jgi:galactose mutarotase-like enzyme
MDKHSIRGDGLIATIAAHGAELTSLQHDVGGELLWQAGAQWPRHSPVLFPIVGRLAGDRLQQGGIDFRVTQHGFARDCRFDWIEQGDERAALRLCDGPETRRLYPFAFILDLIYAVDGQTLSVTTRITNPAETILPCGIGAHPGFRWPLLDDVPKRQHRLEFGTTETGSALSVEGGLLGSPKALPFDGRILDLSPELFARDALVLPDVASRSLRYVAADEGGGERASLAFAWEGFRDLGLWSAPTDAPFLCIEPWYSMASPLGWDGEFADKPGLLLLGPGEARDFVWRVAAEFPDRAAGGPR